MKKKKKELTFYEKLFLKAHGYTLKEWYRKNTLTYEDVKKIYKLKVKK